MTFFISMMRQMCLLVAMLMMCSVSGRVSDNLREAAETEPTMDDNTNRVRCLETTVCGLRQILTSKRDVGKGGGNEDDHSDHLDKLLGASDVTYGQVPWHVDIYRDYDRRCVGVIINEFWILTAATCVRDAGPSRITVVVGNHRLSHYYEGTRRYWVRRVVIHSQFLPSSYDYNIALIKVKPANVSGITNGSGIHFNDYVQPICLPVAGESPAANDNLTVSGFGDRRRVYHEPNAESSSDTLQTAVLPVFNHTRCIRRFPPGDITDRLLCAGRSRDGNTDVCQSDYGGPATYQSGDTHILKGIIIRGSYCVQPIKPVLLTNVLVVKPWIIDRINRFSNRRQRFIPPRADECD